MGSATTQALTATAAALSAASGVDLDVAGELFAASRAVGDSSQLSGALADSAASPVARKKVITDVFAPVLKPTTVSLLTSVVEQRWSSASDLVEGIEELAIRSAAIAAPEADLEGELFRFGRTVAQNPELELALGSRLGGDTSAKGALVERLIGGRASAATTLVVSSLVQQARERRVRELLLRATDLVGEQRGLTVATVTSAVVLSDAQIERLASTLSQRYDSTVSINTVVDPAVVGGLRVQIADDVIDASVSSRLADLRQRLAG